jgi:XTP/dITP diphosphohydrolase
LPSSSSSGRRAARKVVSLIFATSNAHKTEEVAAILGADWQVEDLRAHPLITLDEETGDTFEANAILKAEGISLHVPGWVIADDSGLEVDALGGEPGIYSARYAGPGRSDLENTLLVLKKMDGIPKIQRRARFRCALALAREGKTVALFDGTVEGSLITELEGEGGFGYDPIFIPQGYSETFGQLSEEIKNRISHRACALEQFKEWCKEQENNK